jgi:prophage antirepressor-like protein
MSNVTPFTFNGLDVRTVTLPDGEPGFVGKDVATLLGYADPTNALKQHCRGVAIHHPLQTAGGVQQARVLRESDVMRLIVSSRLPQAEAFEKWVFEEVLPSIRKTGQYVAQSVAQATPLDALKLALTSAQMTSDILNLQGSARLGVVREAHILAGASHLLPMIPVYAIDAPRNADGTLINGSPSSETTASLSTLLKVHKSSLSAVAANKRLQGLGLLEQRTRPSTRGDEIRKYWAVATAGLKFGKNITSPTNPREVQPHWYESSGAELIRLLEGQPY